MEINFAGQYTKAELLQAQKLHALPSPPMLVFRIGCATAAIIFYIVHFFVLPSETLTEEFGIVLPVVIIVMLMTSPFWQPYDAVNKALKDPDFNRLISGKIDESGVTLNAHRSTSVLQWSLFRRVKQKGDLVLLYQDSNWYNLFPRRFFETEEDWNGFQHLVRKNLPR